MDSKEFKQFRNKLEKTQKQIAILLGVSLKAVHSYEQGWRQIPPHVERQMFFLVYQKSTGKSAQKPCWVIKKCPPEKKKRCPAWEFRAGKLCWFITGTLCESEARQDWAEKMKICRSCEVFTSLL